MLKKIMFFLAWLGIFILSLIGIVYVVVPKDLVQFDNYTNIFNHNIIILAISILYFVICIVKLFSLFEKTKDYAIKTEDGIIYISASTITSFIIELLKNDSDISNLKIDTHRRGKKFNITVKLDMSSNGDISGKSMSIQNEVKTKLAEKMGIDVGNVEVKISKLSLKKTETSI